MDAETLREVEKILDRLHDDAEQEGASQEALDLLARAIKRIERLLDEL